MSWELSAWLMSHFSLDKDSLGMLLKKAPVTRRAIIMTANSQEFPVCQSSAGSPRGGDSR